MYVKSHRDYRRLTLALIIICTQVVLSAPAVDKSGTGSQTAAPTVLATPCEFDSCLEGSPPTGFSASDRELL